MGSGARGFAARRYWKTQHRQPELPRGTETVVPHSRVRRSGYLNLQAAHHFAQPEAQAPLAARPETETAELRSVEHTGSGPSPG